MRASLRHELMNCLSIIQGNLELLLLDIEGLDSEQVEMLEDSQRAVGGAIELIEAESIQA